jgi:hypothetical protein
MNKSGIRISKMGLFHTPQSVSEIEEWILKHPKENQAALWTAMGMTWNFLAEAAKVHNEFGGDSSEHLDDCYDDRNEDGSSDLPYGMNV